MPNSGRVVNVTEHTAGSELAEAPYGGALWPSESLWPSEALWPSAATQLSVVDPIDFDADGGYVTLVDVDGNEETVAYVFPDEDQDVLDLLTSLSGTYAEGDPVYLTDQNGRRYVERWADVMQPQAEEALRIRVPHALYALLPLGIREEGTEEQVTFATDGTDEVVTDVLGKAPVVDGTFLDSETVLGPAIASESIVGRHILADELMANKIAAILIISAMLRTADDGQRVEIDVDGIRWYDQNGALGINLPTAEGQPAIFNAEVVAATLDVVGGATFRSASNSLDIGSVLSLQSSRGNPAVGPSVTVGYEQLALAGGDEAQAVGTGLFYTATGDSGGATPTFFAIQNIGITSKLEEYRASDGVFLRTIASPATGTIMGAVQTTVSGTRKIFYLMNSAPPFTANWTLARLDASTLAFEAADTKTSDIPNTSDSASVCLGLIGSNPVILTYSSSSTTAASAGRLLTYDPSTLALSSTQDLSGRNYKPVDNDVRFVGLVDDGTSLWTAVRNDITHGNTAHRYNASTFAFESGHDFSANNVGWRGLTWDGTRFWSKAPGPPLLYKHTTWDWTTESPVYWLGYTWYDGTHETLVSPRTQIDLTNIRRGRLTVTVPTFPSGVTKARLYVARNATAPATTALKLQAPTTYVDTDTAVTIRQINFNDSGAAPPTVNSFTAGTPAIIIATQTTGTSWFLGGDGSFRIPKFTTTERDALTTTGMAGWVIYNSTTQKLNFWDGAAWQAVTST